MIQVIQIFKKQARILKPYYSSEFRREFRKWDTHAMSSFGYKKDEKFILHISLKRNYSSKKDGLIIIQVSVPYTQTEKIKELVKNVKELKISPWVFEEQLFSNRIDELTTTFFSAPINKCLFEIFTLKQSESGIMELSLNYQEHAGIIGEPKREDHKLCELKKELPVRICINGKTDNLNYPLAGENQCSYYELEYIIEYLGEMSSIEFAGWNNATVDKEIPTDFHKTIDLREVLS